MRPHLHLAFALCGLFSLAANAQQSSPTAITPGNSATAPAPLTLAQAEALAIKNNPQIAIGKLRALISQEQFRETRSALLPNVSISLTGVESQPGGRVSAGALNNPVIYPRAAGGLVFNQLLTDFGRTPNLVSSSQLQAAAEDQNAAATRAQILLAVDHAFYAALETQALVHVADETVKDRQLLTDKISALAQAQLKSDLDASFANVDLSRAKLLSLEAQNNFAASLAELSALLGFADQRNFQLLDEPGNVSTPTPDVQPLLQQALAQRPEALALRLEVQSAEKFSHAEHDLWRPTVSALGVVGEAPIRDDHIPNWYGAAGVNVSIPVFNGFLNNARAKASDLETETKRQALLDLQNNIARDVRISWQDSTRAFERLSVTAQLRKQANLALELARSRYNLGLSSIVEYSQAELQKTEADITDTDALYQFRQSQRALDFATGTLK